MRRAARDAARLRRDGDAADQLRRSAPAAPTPRSLGCCFLSEATVDTRLTRLMANWTDQAGPKILVAAYRTGLAVPGPAG